MLVTHTLFSSPSGGGGGPAAAAQHYSRMAWNSFVQHVVTQQLHSYKRSPHTELSSWPCWLQRHHLLLHSSLRAATHPYRMSHYRMELRQCFIGWNRVACSLAATSNKPPWTTSCVSFVTVDPIQLLTMPWNKLPHKDGTESHHNTTTSPPIKGVPTQNWARDRAGHLLHTACELRHTPYRMSHYRMARIELRQCFIGWNRVATNPPIRAQRTTSDGKVIEILKCWFKNICLIQLKYSTTYIN